MSFSSDQPLLSNQLPTSINLDPSKAEFQNQLNLALRRMIDSINTKEGALYLLNEIATFKQLYNLTTGNDVYALSKNRNVYRRTWDLIEENGNAPIGPGPGNAVSNPHDITSLTDAVLMYASFRTDADELWSVVYPYAGVVGANYYFENPTADNVTSGILVLEYTKN